MNEVERKIKVELYYKDAKLGETVRDRAEQKFEGVLHAFRLHCQVLFKVKEGSLPITVFMLPHHQVLQRDCSTIKDPSKDLVLFFYENSRILLHTLYVLKSPQILCASDVQYH